MKHAELRCDERLTAQEKTASLQASEIFAAQNPQGSHAILIATMNKIRGQIWSDESNGNTIVAVIRDGVVKTIMLRRKSQPFTREALRVDKCWTLKI